MARTCLILTASLAVALAGCSSVEMPKGNSKGYSTARFEVEGAKPLPKFAKIDADVNGMIQKSVSELFVKCGLTFRPATDTSDLVVAYLLIMQNAVGTTAIEDYFGNGRDAESLISAAHEKWVVKGNPEDRFEAGTLVVDVLHSGTGKLIYRGYARGEIDRDISDEVRQDRIAAAVAEALQPFFR
jgi:hypothetical protein